ncbi:MAG: thioredoxin-dependent thiol peroxidase [Deltaproteobacteria bacterium]|nr:thioredoxin-dependent thiol peroxidase [Deltaproteobacteria bacterium]
MAAIKEGQKAPDFTLESDSGEKVTLSRLKGQKVVLFFYPKDMTPGCTIEACDFRDNYPKFKKKGVAVFGVSKLNAKSKAKFRDKHKLNYPLLADEDLKVVTSWGILKDKVMYGKKVKGIERTTVLIGEDGKIGKIWPKVQIEGHVEEVLKAL